MLRTTLRVLCLLLLSVELSGQTVLSVPSAAWPTIQSAMNAASAGDVIQVAAGTYQENLVWPPVEFHLKGAGPGVSIIDGGQMGSCVKYNYRVGPAAILEGFTLTNGTGELASIGGNMFYQGGAIHMNEIFLGTAAPVFEPTVKNCEITGNSATEGGGVFLRYGGVLFENCEFSNNTVSATGPSSVGAKASAIFFQAQTFHTVTLRNCVFRQHTGNSTVSFDWETQVRMEGCTFEQNNTQYQVRGTASPFFVSSCKFINNTGVDILFVLQGNAPGYRISSNLFANNVISGSIIVNTYNSNPPPPPQEILNNTIVQNVLQPTAFPSGLVWMPTPSIMSDCIIRGNTDGNGGLVMNPLYFPYGASGVTIQHSNIQGYSGGLNNVNTPPLFVDYQNGDYRLKPGSPMIDAGAVQPALTANITRSPHDVRGLPRIKGAAVDIGAFEAQAMAHHPASRGQVGAGAGGPFNILKMNGSHGGLWRRISVPIGTASSLEMDQPGHLLYPVQFAVYGVIGEAGFDSVVNVPLGIGDMMFAPAPMIPFLHPSFFMLASTFGPLGFWQPLFNANPTPFNSGPGPVIPFPFKMTIQGIIEEAPGVYVPTNALIFEVK